MLAPGESLFPNHWDGEDTQLLSSIFHLDKLTLNDVKKLFLSNGHKIAKKRAHSPQTLRSCEFISALMNIKLNWLNKDLAQLNLIQLGNLYVQSMECVG